MITQTFQQDYDRLLARPMLERPVVRQLWCAICQDLRAPIVPAESAEVIQ